MLFNLFLICLYFFKTDELPAFKAIDFDMSLLRHFIIQPRFVIRTNHYENMPIQIYRKFHSKN